MTQSSPPRATFMVAMGSDHAGVELKAALKKALEGAGHTVEDFGTHGSESVDYPDFANKVAQSVSSGHAPFGVLVCGTGIGISIAANRHPKIRCALVHDVTGARLTRQHNDANVISIGARQHTVEEAKRFIDCFIAEPFSGEERHARRIAQLAEFERTGAIAGRAVPGAGPAD